MYTTSNYAAQLRNIEQTGVVVMPNISRFAQYNVDSLCPHFSIMLMERGSVKTLYDMREMTQCEGEISCLMPGHIVRTIESSDDMQATVMVLSHKLFDELQFHVFSHDFEKFNIAPISPLSAEQTQQIKSITDQIAFVAAHSEEEMPNRYSMIISLLAVGYEYLNYYRRELDKDWHDNRNAGLLTRFCDLVALHYRESREVQYYADLLHLTPKYFSKVISSLTGESPADYIDQYVVVQAKQLLDKRPMTVKETAYRLGFNESASFCRFFKRVTGQTPQEYRNA